MSKPKAPNRSLRYYREVRNWTQEQAAEALLELCGPGRRGEINAKMISKWERGVQTPSLEYREKLCKLYGVQSPEELGIVKREEPSEVLLTQKKFPVSTILSNASHIHSQQQEHPWLTQGASYLGQLLTEGWSINEILDSLQLVLQGVQGMPSIMRRRLLALGAEATISGIPVLSGEHVSEEELMQLHHALGESIVAGWKLFHTAGNAQVLAVGQALLHIVQQNHSYLSSRIRAMHYSSVYNLIGVALSFQEQYQLALDVHMNAHVASLATGEVWYVVQSLLCQTTAYQALGQYNKAIQTIEEAFRVLGDQFEVKYVRAKAHLLGCYADNSIKVGDYRNAQRQLEASEVLLDQIGPSEEFDATSWLHLAGNFALATRNYSKAIHFFEKALSMPQTSNLRHASTSVALAAAYLYEDENASLAVVEQNVSIIEIVNAPLVNKQLADYVQQGLLITSPENERVKTFVSAIQYRIPSLNRYIAALH